MAENKKSFILYTDMIHTVRKLPKGKQAELFMAILEFVNDENPVVKDILVSIAFEPIKHQLKRDLIRWDNFKKKQCENGKLGGRPKKEINPNNPSLLEETQKSLTVTVTDTVTVNVKKKESEEEKPDLKNSNLFRSPTVPTKSQVWEAFSFQGGTKEMAKGFYEKYESVSWFKNGSPITNFKSLVPSFIMNWQNNEKSKKSYEPASTAPPLKRVS